VLGAPGLSGPAEDAPLVARGKVLRDAVNVVAVLSILVSKRLFGLRGGHAAYVAQRHEASLLEVEAAAGAAPALVKPGVSAG